MSSVDRDDVTYLTVENVLDLYADEFDRTPEAARMHLRSPTGLEGALARPLWYARYRDADLALQAATIAHGIAEGQPFIDGNKRIALLVMATFLMVNGLNLDAPPVNLFRWILRLSEGMTVEQLAGLIRSHLVTRE